MNYRLELLTQKAFRLALYGLCACTLVFLVAPLLAIMPLSFNSEPFFTYPMPGYSLQWYREFFESETWHLAMKNSFIVAIAATVCSCLLGTLAALGLNRKDCPMRSLLMGILISPMVIPIVVSAVGVYYYFADLGLLNSLTGLVIAHTALGAPFVVITVAATLSTFDQNLMRAAASLGAPPLTAFRRVMLPIIAPGIASGALFAFVTSFDEVVMALFLAGPEQRTLPRQMWIGVREQISPTITAVATCLILFSILLLVTVQWLQGRAQRNKARPAA
ncbi:ABC transporter permease [Polaromonas sp.]|uniref:ABC transporter permease n=1 Tax=Polaromonas sp. TaxID=1869339 RepID=UPI00326601B1